jgi:hypothetical protein
MCLGKLAKRIGHARPSLLSVVGDARRCPPIGIGVSVLAVLCVSAGCLGRPCRRVSDRRLQSALSSGRRWWVSGHSIKLLI